MKPALLLDSPNDELVPGFRASAPLVLLAGSRLVLCCLSFGSVSV